ncbi:MAG: 2-amino-4-hydroxy-6-hydroxymethyldihydropteridine diphosphokinase [Trueperaceae bacterium]
MSGVSRAASQASTASRASTAGPRALVALGSNLNDPYAQMCRARDLLAALGNLRAKSSLYRTAPVGGPAGQPPYLNAVVALVPHPHLHDPGAFLAALLDVEARMGRTRSVRWGPRTIDLDLLDFGGAVVRSPGLTLPHPRMFERWFVLAPLCELDPGYRHPLDGRNACDALARRERTHAARRDATARAGSEGGEPPAGERTTLPW